MQFHLVWLLVRGSGPGSGDAKSAHEPGSGETQKSVVSSGPGCSDAEASFGTRVQAKQKSWT